MVGPVLVKIGDLWGDRGGWGNLKVVLLVALIAGVTISVLAKSPNLLSLTTMFNVPFQAITALALR